MRFAPVRYYPCHRHHLHCYETKSTLVHMCYYLQEGRSSWLRDYFLALLHQISPGEWHGLVLYGLMISWFDDFVIRRFRLMQFSDEMFAWLAFVALMAGCGCIAITIFLVIAVIISWQSNTTETLLTISPVFPIRLGKLPMTLSSSKKKVIYPKMSTSSRYRFFQSKNVWKMLRVSSKWRYDPWRQRATMASISVGNRGQGKEWDLQGDAHPTRNDVCGMSGHVLTCVIQFYW